MNTARSLKLLWVTEQRAKWEIPAFGKSLNKIYICLYLVLRLAAAPKAGWASTSVSV